MTEVGFKQLAFRMCIMKKCKFFAMIIAVCCFFTLLSACVQLAHEQIAADWGKLHNREKEEVHVDCYGEFDGAHVVMLTMDEEGFMAVVGGETVGGVEFRYNYASLRFNVWYDGSFYTLQEAFDEGILTHDDLLTVRENHKAEFSFMYKTESN